MAFFSSKKKAKVKAKVQPQNYYSGRNPDSVEGEAYASTYFADLRDKHHRLIPYGYRHNIWDATAIAYSAEHSARLPTWSAVEAQLASFRILARQAYGRDMLEEDPTSKVGAALLQRPDGSHRVVFGFTATRFPGVSSQKSREKRILRCRAFCARLGVHPPLLQSEGNSVPGSCVEMFTFARVLDAEGDARRVRGRLTTTVWNLGSSGYRPLQMCKNCKRYAEVLRRACPGLTIVDRG